MRANEAIAAVQAALLIPEGERVPHIGPFTRRRFEQLAALGADDPWNPESIAVLPPGKVVTAPAGTAGRNISERGILLVKEFEGCQLTAYLDEAGVWTIGMGHTGLQHMDGTVHAGRTITMEQAEALFDYDMNQFEARVSALVKVPLNQDEFDALVSFDFNTGGLTLKGGEPSTLLRYLNLDQRENTAGQFMVWNKVKGKVLNGLTRRRMSERNLFQGKTPYIVSEAEFANWKSKQPA